MHARDGIVVVGQHAHLVGVVELQRIPRRVVELVPHPGVVCVVAAQHIDAVAVRVVFIEPRTPLPRARDEHRHRLRLALGISEHIARAIGGEVHRAQNRDAGIHVAHLIIHPPRTRRRVLHEHLRIRRRRGSTWPDVARGAEQAAFVRLQRQRFQRLRHGGTDRLARRIVVLGENHVREGRVLRVRRPHELMQRPARPAHDEEHRRRAMRCQRRGDGRACGHHLVVEDVHVFCHREGDVAIATNRAHGVCRRRARARRAEEAQHRVVCLVAILRAARHRGRPRHRRRHGQAHRRRIKGLRRRDAGRIGDDADFQLPRRRGCRVEHLHHIAIAIHCHARAHPAGSLDRWRRKSPRRQSSERPVEIAHRNRDEAQPVLRQQRWVAPRRVRVIHTHLQRRLPGTVKIHVQARRRILRLAFVRHAQALAVKLPRPRGIRGDDGERQLGALQLHLNRRGEGRRNEERSEREEEGLDAFHGSPCSGPCDGAAAFWSHRGEEVRVSSSPKTHGSPRGSGRGRPSLGWHRVWISRTSARLRPRRRWAVG